MQIRNVLDFLNHLNQNNKRDWFTTNKALYEQARKEFKTFVQQLIEHISIFDKDLSGLQAKDCVFRIYRDVRFSKDKRPYKTNMGAYMAPGGRKSNLAGYYLHVEPEGSFAGGGIYCPQSDVLKAVRSEIFSDPASFEDIIHQSEFKATFPDIYGEKLKTAPRGFDKNWEKIDLLRYKSYTVIKQFADREVVSDDFITKLLHTYQVQQPFNQYLNETIKQI